MFAVAFGSYCLGFPLPPFNAIFASHLKYGSLHFQCISHWFIIPFFTVYQLVLLTSGNNNVAFACGVLHGKTEACTNNTVILGENDL